ncbi:MAG: formylglycine-generating enzyme family protein [Thermoguttaceae bacterium]|jgi:formylglycine-generating enzyme required for sulfatase activity
MPEAFDPYHKWLGIPPEEQPANHYRLLGIKPLETDPDVVEAAADQRMAHLRTYQAGKQSGLSQKLLNEVAAAKICLMNPAKKAAYDQRLRPQLEAKAAAGGQGAAAGFDVDGLLGGTLDDGGRTTGGIASVRRPSSVARRDGIPRTWLLAGAGAAAAALLAIAAVWTLSGPGNAPEETAQDPARQPSVNPPPKPPDTPNPPDTPKPSGTAKPSDTPRLTDLLSKINSAPPVEAPQPQALQPPPPPKVVAAPDAGSQTINLLALVQPAKHTANGEWELRESGLATVREDSCSLILAPVIPEGSFELETEFTRLEGDGCAALLFPIGSSFAFVEVSGHHGRFSGLAPINGWGTDASNNPTARPSTISNHVRYKLAVRVQNVNDNQVEISGQLDGASLFRWQGPASALSGGSFWRMSRLATVGLGTDTSLTVFHTARLRMLDGQAKNLEGKIVTAGGAKGRREHQKTGPPSPGTLPITVVVTQGSTGPPVVAPVNPPPQPPPGEPASEPAAPKEPQPGEKAERLAVPSDAVQKEALATIEEVYHLASVTTPAAKAKLAKELFELGEKSQGKPGEQFTLLRTAAELATDVGEVETMCQAVDGMGTVFAVDPLAIKCKLLLKFGSGASTAAAITTFMQAAENVTQQALADDRYDLAENLNTAAVRLAQKSLGKQYLKAVRERQQEIQRCQKDWGAVREALETLKAHADDAEANLVAGGWYCFRKGDWEKGLPYLAKGSDERLKKVAQQEVDAPPTEAAEQVKLADDWWALAQHNKDGKEALASRAGEWYTKALPAYPAGIMHVKITKRLEEMDKAEKAEKASPTRVGTAAGGNRIRPGRWCPLLARPQDLEAWIVTAGTQGAFETGQPAQKFFGQTLELAHNEIFCPIVATDATIHAKVKIISGNSVRLMLRKSEGGYYYANVEGNSRSVTIGKFEQFPGRGQWSPIRSGNLPQPPGNAPFEFAFAALGDHLAVAVNRVPVVEVHDSTHQRGTIGIGTLKSSAQFTAVELFVPKQEALIADNRPSSKPAPGKPRGRLSLGKLPHRVTNSIGMKLVLIPAGEFMMGSPDSDTKAKPHEKPQHRVRITRPFYMAVCEVSQGDVQRVTGKEGSSHSTAVQDPNQLPTEELTWEDAVDFCSRLSQLQEEQAAGRTYRLPTEAEWEYACRAGSTTKWHFGDDPAAGTEYLWYRDNAGGTLHGVGEKKPNAWGLCDMHGNAREWCADWYNPDYYQVSPAVDPQGPPTGTERVIRGGTAFDNADYTCSTTRASMRQEYRGGWTSFRVVMVPVR